MSGVILTTNEAGDVFIGFDADGTFVPFASVTANRIAQLQERAANLSELAKEEGAASAARHSEAANALPYTASGKATAGSGSAAKGGGS